jgi:hypothetical protein
MGKKNTYLPYILLLLALGLVWIFMRSRREYFSQQIPKKIWAYWDDEDIKNKTVLLCIQSWKKYNPDYEVVVLNPKTVKYYLDLDIENMKMNDGPTRESDIIRINILQKYGGVWVDASILMTAPLDFTSEEYEYYGYKIAKFESKAGIPVIENWFFATIPGGKFITAWRDEFMNANKFSNVEEALESLKKQGVQYDKISGPVYLFMHICAQKVLQKDMSPDEIKKTFFLRTAEDTALKYLDVNGWDSGKALESLCRGENVMPLIKFRGAERGYLEDHPDLRDCIFKKYI